MKSSLLRCLLLTLGLCAANLFAQGPVMTPPPWSGLSTVLPPAPNSLPAPVLEWEPLPPSPSGGGSSSVPLPAALFVAPLPPAPALPLPAPPPVVPFVSSPSDPAEFELTKPRFEIWRNGAEAPEIPTQIKGGLHSTLVTSGDPITVRLLFDPSLTGTPLSVTPDKGVAMTPAQGVLIGPSGECLFTVDLESGQEESQISFYSMKINTVLRLTAATPEFIGLLANP